MKIIIALFVSLAMASATDAGTVSVTWSPTVGLPGWTTATLWIDANAGEAFQGVDATFTGPMNQLNPFGLNTTFTDANSAIIGTGGDPTQDSHFLFASAEVLSIGVTESANLLTGAISGINLIAGGVPNPTPFAQVVFLDGTGVNIDVDLSFDLGTGQPAIFGGTLGRPLDPHGCPINDPNCPEPSSALLALLGLVGVAAQRNKKTLASKAL